jgi:penicillin-insensitive murein endopeptidase
VSLGTTSDGAVRRAAELPARGRGFFVPKRWRERGFHYGTDELVGTLRRAAAVVRGEDRRVYLGVADLSPPGGGGSAFHRSHASGRDVDLLFYTTDRAGNPLPPPSFGMIAFHSNGHPFRPEGVPPYDDAGWQDRRFDDERNWGLVEALLTDPEVRVQWIFVSGGLRGRLLAWAERAGRPAWLRSLAAHVLRQPGAAAPHDDHFHVRLYCARSDRPHGCVDTGPVWQHEKKAYKYSGPERYDPWTWRALAVRPRVGLL